jgi:hypothetical protein
VFFAPFPRLPPVPISAYHLLHASDDNVFLSAVQSSFCMLCHTPSFLPTSCSWSLNLPAFSIFPQVFKDLLHFFACSELSGQCLACCQFLPTFSTLPARWSCCMPSFYVFLHMSHSYMLLYQLSQLNKRCSLFPIGPNHY